MDTIHPIWNRGDVCVLLGGDKLNRLQPTTPIAKLLNPVAHWAAPDSVDQLTVGGR